MFIQVSELKVPVSDFEQLVKNDLDIIECHRVTGTVGYFLKAALADMDSMRLLIDRLIPYGHLNTSVVLTSPVPSAPFFQGSMKWRIMVQNPRRSFN